MKTLKLFLSLLMAIMLLGISDANAQYTLKAVGGFEGNTPAFWTKGNEPTGTTLSWATDQFISMGHSLKIQKTAIGDSAAWISENMADLWSPTISKNVDILLGSYVKTQGVNTNPTSADQKWYISYTFYDSSGNLMGETKLPIDQTNASSNGWIADTNAVGQTVLPKDAWKVIISFVGGKNATGTVWADNFILVGRKAWAGQDWNTSVGVPTGWYYWLPPNGGNDGKLNSGFENTTITSTEAHSGKYSLEFDMPPGRNVHDGFVGIHRMPFSDIDPNIKPGDVVRISVWIKASGLYPDSAAKYPTTWAVGVTPQFFTDMGNNAGWGGSGSDYQFTFPNVTSFDWTQYHIDTQVPKDTTTKGLGVRLHVYSTFVGKVYFDDVTVTKLSVATGVKLNRLLPSSFKVYQNYPNPFNPSTIISYALPKASPVKVVIYDITGKEVKTLVNKEQTAGMHSVTWNGENNNGMMVSSGIYFYRISARLNVQVRKMILLK